MEGWKKFILETLLVLFILFVLRSFIGLEFDAYPHKEITLKGNMPYKYDSLIICPDWNDKTPSLRLEYQNNDSDFICDYVESWNNLDKERINFRGNYQVVVMETGAYFTPQEIEVEVTYLNRAFFVFRGKGFLYA